MRSQTIILKLIIMEAALSITFKMMLMLQTVLQSIKTKMI